ncbi:hybrid sensor histidine kinase/response regulator [Methyloprofundus sedimenti]|uniref:histidine kinase n=1 Tax=Methyloprofundus sedimenti TaxID=1420851 RepID=A0A1V8M215_9GAMM|nr:response regulator [Methyloprofundus sedimenti]OQK15536.1 hybrid sensor histidine kinase/response regulator [Methyloprofundus sedimenti]
MSTTVHQSITKIRRDYNSWVANETMEDYALRFAPRSFRKWSEFQVASTAFGSTSFLVLEAIGGFLSLHYGFTNAFWAIIIVGLIIFIISFPISYYAARYSIDIDLLTRSAGFGYFGSTLTSLIYASFTFTLFALEASIMSQAIELYFAIPIAWAHLISAIIVIPLVTFGITTISRLQLWTQPLWLLLLFIPYFAVITREPEALLTAKAYFGIAASGQGFNWLLFGSATTIAFSMVAQIGEQVDFLRFMPEKNATNRFRWWTATIVAGPGWIVFGVARQLGGAMLAHLAINKGVSLAHAHEPTQMYFVAYSTLIDNADIALGITTLFVIISQIKINVTNAYAGSLAWSNFFSRITHSHPGRVIWLIFNVSIALLLMEFGVFGALEKVLGLFSNITIAWISVVAAELLINKPLGLSPKIIEFKRAYLPDLNPVGLIATFLASLISILTYLGLFGDYAQAFSAFISLGLAFILTPSIACFTSYRHYLARARHYKHEIVQRQCCICENSFEHEDIAFCPAYQGSICSLCCTLDARCLDQCKPGARLNDYLENFAEYLLPKQMRLEAKLRLLRFTLLFVFLSTLTSIFICIIYYQDLLIAETYPPSFDLLFENFIKVYSSLLVFIGLCTWWLVLNGESRQVAHEEMAKQTQRLLMEIEQHKITDAKLQQAMQAADNANSAKSRFLSNMSHEIRTPLNCIVGYSHILHKDPLIPEHRLEAVEILKRSGEHLSSLIEDILDIAGIEARKFDLRYEPLNFPEFIDHLVSIYSALSEDKGLLFRCQIADPLPQKIRGDEKRIRQVLINLLNNAVKFTSTGEIVLRINYRSEVATFQIIDSGEGIETQNIEEIFLPFIRLSQSTGNAVDGSGLGLTISKILTELMGGELTVSSEKGKGSIFTVRLLLPNLKDVIDIPEEENIVGFQGKTRKILVVDDQYEQRNLIVSLLGPLGFHVENSESGEQCLSKVPDFMPDLILLDLAMSGLCGIETARQLREQNYRMPIIVLSANAYPSDRQAAIKAGSNDFLSKPLKMQDLLSKLKLHLSLNWIYQGNKTHQSIITTTAPMIIPPPNIINDLIQFVRIGDLLGLKQELNELIKSDSGYQAFALRIRTLATEFRIGEIKKILNVQNDTH